MILARPGTRDLVRGQKRFNNAQDHSGRQVMAKHATLSHWWVVCKVEASASCSAATAFMQLVYFNVRWELFATTD